MSGSHPIGPDMRQMSLVDHLNDAARARFDQHGFAVHHSVAVRRGAERLRHVIEGHAALGQDRADNDATRSRTIY
jgi:hypothetical protein